MEHRLGMRVYFSSYHLWASKHLIELASHIESEHTSRSHFDIRQRTYVTSSILSSLSFLEAAVNELFQDAVDRYYIRIHSLDDESKDKLSEFWTSGKERQPTITEKYNIALELCKKELFNKGSNPYQDADLARKLRNTLVHYKPETSFADEISKLEGQLKDKFQLNPLFRGSNNPLYPDHILGNGCSIWVRNTCKNLADEFFNRLGIEPHYQTVTFD